MLGAHKSHPELSPIADQSALLLLLPEIRELKLNYWLTLSCSQLNARACPITITHKAILASAQQGTEGTCQHIPPESFFLYPWLTHDKSWKELPPQHSLEHVCTRRGKGFSAEGSKGVCMKGDGRRRAKRSRNEKTGHRLRQPAGHRFKRSTLLPALGLRCIGWPPLHPLSTLRSLCIATMDIARTLQHVQSLLASLPTHGPFTGAFPARGGSTDRFLPTSTIVIHVQEASQHSC